MFRTIVVGIDGSPTASLALEKAASMAKSFGARLHLVSAFKDASILASVAADPLAGGLVAGVVALEPELRQPVEALLEKSAGNIDETIQVETHAVAGEPSDVILDVAEAVKADLIIVGNRGMRGGKRLLLGSVPNRVAHHASCDVLIVHTS